MGMDVRKKKAAVRLATMQRTEKAVALRLTGLLLREIGARLGVTRGRVSQMINAYLAEVRGRTLMGAEQLLALELSRIDALLMALWPNRKLPKSASAILRVLERRHKLLGLDAPNRAELTSDDSAPTRNTDSTIDVTKLNDEELSWLENILAKFESASS